MSVTAVSPRPQPSWSCGSDFDYLIASDMHLTLSLDDVDKATNFELASFLGHYSRHRSGRRWMLILAGDTFDLLYPGMELFVQRHPGPEAPDASGDGRLRHAPIPEVAWRLRATMLERREVFLALGRFVLAGNLVVFIKGNHDVELQWAALQSAVRRTLCEILGIAPDSPDGAVVHRGIEFRDWFHFEPGVLYVEHGSQYDEFNCTPNLLDPALVHDTQRAFMPLGSRMTAYLTNAFVDYRPRPSSGAFMAYIRQSGQLFSKKFVGRSLAVISHALGNAGPFSEEGWRTGTGKEDHALSRMSERSGLGVDTLRQIQALGAQPATAIRGFFFNRMFLDRLFVVFYTMLMVGVALAFEAVKWSEPALIVGTALAPVIGVTAGVLRFKKDLRWTATRKWALPTVLVGGVLLAPLLLEGGTASGTFIVAFACLVGSVSLAIMPLTEVLDLGAHLSARGAAIGALLDVPVVVFGHHHKPRVDELPGGGVYINCGAWVSSGVEKNHSHVVVLRQPDGTTWTTLISGRDFYESGDSP